MLLWRQHVMRIESRGRQLPRSSGFLRSAGPCYGPRCAQQRFWIKKRAVLEPHQLVLVLEERQIATGRARARVGRLSRHSAEDLGWLSTATEQGDNILAPLAPAEAAAAWRGAGSPWPSGIQRTTMLSWPSNRPGQQTRRVDRGPTTSAKLDMTLTSSNG